MSLRFALLGLLAEGPSSGYELTRRFEEGIGSFAWTAGHSQIYPELARLVGDGLVEVVAEGPRGRRDHAITTAGRAALRAWLLGPHDAGGTVRNEFVLRLFLLSALEVADATAVLDDVERYVDAQIIEIQDAQRDIAAAGLPVTSGPSMAAEFGLRTYRATSDWAGWAREQLAQRR
jgi:PadR family transcriptional regulator, regulatory protein AphA